MFANIISYAYDFNIIVNGALVRELEGTACAFRCCGRMYHILHHSIQYRLTAVHAYLETLDDYC